MSMADGDQRGSFGPGCGGHDADGMVAEPECVGVAQARPPRGTCRVGPGDVGRALRSGLDGSRRTTIPRVRRFSCSKACSRMSTAIGRLGTFLLNPEGFRHAPFSDRWLRAVGQAEAIRRTGTQARSRRYASNGLPGAERDSGRRQQGALRAGRLLGSHADRALGCRCGPRGHPATRTAPSCSCSTANLPTRPEHTPPAAGCAFRSVRGIIPVPREDARFT